jgi:hypothetical protein
LAVRRKKNNKDKKLVSVNRFAIRGQFTRAIFAHQIFLKALLCFLTGYIFVAPKHRVPTDQSSDNWYRWKGFGM